MYLFRHWKNICGDQHKCSTEEETALKKGTIISFFWGDDEGYLLGKIVVVTSRSFKNRAFPYYVRHNNERDQQGHVLSIDVMASAGPQGT